MPNADPSLSVAERVDAACDEFEREWRAGRRPSVDAYVAAALETDRDALRSALSAVESELKAGRGAGDTSISKESVRTGVHHEPGVTVARPKESPGSRPGPTTGAWPADQSTAPNRIGRFEVRAVLGTGAFGCVYRAFDSSLDREVAIKVPLPDSLRTPADRERFTKEAKAAAAIDHANVCRIHEVGEHEGQPYIVMAFVPGQSLADMLRGRKEPLPEKQAAIIIRKLALALDAAHKKGVVHRDLKPANIMWNKEKKDLVVMDFGLARRDVAGDVRATQTGVVMGTPAYMSPEQARGAAKEVGPEGDIFSLGIIMYELLTGTRPFNGTAHEVIGQILLLDPEPPSQRRAGVNPQLEAVCLKAMAKDPANRFASMKDFASAVDGYLRKPASGAETARAVETTPSAETESTTDADLSTNTRKLADVFAAMTEESVEKKTERKKATERAIEKPHSPRLKILLGIAGGILLIVATVVGSVIFFVKNDKGTAKSIAELTDIDLKDKTLTFFLDGEPITAEQLAKSTELSPGDHVFEVKREKVIVKRFLLSVSSGRDAGITVRDIPPPQKSSSQPKPENPIVPVTSAPVDPFQTNSVWEGVTAVKQTLTVLERKGDTFRAKFEVGNRIVREVNGTIKDGKVTWHRKDVRVVSGSGPGGDNFGTIGRDLTGEKIDFEYESDKGSSGTFTLRLRESNEFVPLFGMDLTDWDALPNTWELDNGVLTGVLPLGRDKSTFLCSKKVYADFELMFDVKLKNGKGNSGVHIRSALVDANDFLVAGPQVDIDATLGGLYGERNPGKWLKQAPEDVIRRVFKPNDFNTYYVRAVDKCVTITLNDAGLVVNEEFPDMPADGSIAFQLHGGKSKPEEVTFRNVRIRELKPKK